MRIVLPSEQLLWEGAILAIGVVLEAEILIDLEEGLMVPGLLKKVGFLWAVTKETIARALDPIRGRASGQFGIVWPMTLRILGQAQGVQGVGEKVTGPLFTEQSDRSWGTGRSEGVVMVPKFVLAGLDLVHELRERLVGEFFQSGPCGQQGGESGHPPLRVVGGAHSGKLPREGPWIGMGSVFPPRGPEFAQPLVGLGWSRVGQVGCEKASEPEEIASPFQRREIPHLGEGRALGQQGHRELVLVVAQGVGECLPESLRIAVGLGNTGETGCLGPCTMKGRLF